MMHVKFSYHCWVHVMLLPDPPLMGRHSNASTLSLVLQAEIQTKAATIEKNKGTVGVASRIQAALNSEGLKVNEFIAQSHQKQARLDELSKLHPQLQQVFCCSAVFR